MERKGSYGASWADQWDYSDHGGETKGSAGAGSKNSGLEKTKAAAATGLQKTKAVAATGLEKTKAVASIGFKKAKEGTTAGFNWIKVKYQKRTQKN